MVSGNRVLELRTKLHIDQVTFARFLGASRGSVSNWERGVTTPSVFQIRLMNQMEQYGVNAQYCGFPWLLIQEARRIL